ncbi:RNA methyltransferase [soil metagenome]
MSVVPAAITSRHNPRFRQALALRDARQRRRSGRLLVDGAREVGRAVAAVHAALEAWVAFERIRSEDARAVLADLGAAGADVLEVSAELLARLAYGDRDEGLVAVFPLPATDIGRLELPASPLVGVLVGLEKPGNLGAVMRSADGAGVDALIVADPTSDVWNPNAIRASLGTVFSLRLAVCTSEEARAELTGRGIRMVAADPGGEVGYDQVDRRGSVAIVLGAEATGLPDAWRGGDVVRTRIPMHGAADSLNVAASAAILFYEAHRQRGDTPRPR